MIENGTDAGGATEAGGGEIGASLGEIGAALGEIGAAEDGTGLAAEGTGAEIRIGLATEPVCDSGGAMCCSDARPAVRRSPRRGVGGSG
ncbi:hypothetical protein ACFWCF_19430 [Rhodococcus sp. NPDC060090]|uniref:hypothetical protein n=1 Tax=Rhodococcus sp. NPDC060090 TaxID=3347056 RepID=UPI0036575F4E